MLLFTCCPVLLSRFDQSAALNAVYGISLLIWPECVPAYLPDQPGLVHHLQRCWFWRAVSHQHHSPKQASSKEHLKQRHHRLDHSCVLGPSCVLG